MKLRTLIAALVLLATATYSGTARAEESALLKKNEQALETATNDVAKAQDDKTRQEALHQKAIALNSLGRSAEALSTIDEAIALPAGKRALRIDRAIILDTLGRSAEARKEWNKLLAEGAEGAKDARRVFTETKYTPADSDWMDKLDAGVSARIPSAINYYLLNANDEAESVFRKIISIKVGNDKSSSYIGKSVGKMMTDDAHYSERWMLWYTAYDNRGDTQRAVKALKNYASPGLLRKQLGGPRLKETDAFNIILKRYYLGEVSFDDVLNEIETCATTPENKESMRTEAHFFCAGYLKYVKHDNDAAVSMLTAEDKRPFNGSVERILIKHELLPPGANQPSFVDTLEIDPDPVPGVSAGRVTVLSGLTTDTVRSCIMRAFKGHSWEITKDAKGKIVGKQPDVIVTMTYDEQAIVLTCDSKLKGGKIPTNWLEGLKKDLNAFMRRTNTETN